MEGKKVEPKLKAMCLLLDDQSRLLASQGYDHIKKQRFYRILGGHLNPGEDPADGVRREIREEVNSEIDNLEFLEVIDNQFIYQGRPGHEIVHLYKGKLSRREIEDIPQFTFVDGPEVITAQWIKIDDIIHKKIIVYPHFDVKKYRV
ncbi:MAG: hypothetical protein C3F02_04505 [Parcubacteria group bacterium]|nr:MAG: hypothetical protein C3F02_04505 [Parcubacteria group bacterium]